MALAVVHPEMIRHPGRNRAPQASRLMEFNKEQLQLQQLKRVSAAAAAAKPAPAAAQRAAATASGLPAGWKINDEPPPGWEKTPLPPLPKDWKPSDGPPPLPPGWLPIRPIASSAAAGSAAASKPALGFLLNPHIQMVHHDATSSDEELSD